MTGDEISLIPFLIHHKPLPSSSKVILIEDEEYEVEEEVPFPRDRFSVLLRLTSPVLQHHLQS